MSYIPAPVLLELGLGMLEGGLKYGRHNYRAVGVRGSVYYDATMRHLMAWWEGEDFDPDSKVGLHHISKAIASLVVLRDAMIQNKIVDDRPPKTRDGWIAQLNDQAKALVEACPDPVAPYTQVDESWSEPRDLPKPYYTLRGGPGKDYPCKNDGTLECALSACQIHRSCQRVPR